MKVKFPDIANQQLIPQKSREDVFTAMERKDKIKRFAENYREILQEVEDGLRKIELKYGFNLGVFRVYWVGGRIKNSKIDVDSDVDLLFSFGYDRSSLRWNKDALNEFREMLFHVFRKWDLNIPIDDKRSLPLYDGKFTGWFFDKKRNKVSVTDSKKVPYIQLHPILVEPKIRRSFLDYVNVLLK